jgi:hypothetical protein
MNRDVERANEALAAGRPNEASVYAWNALADIGSDEAPQLARIARELDEPLLLREMHRRGFTTVPAPLPEAEPEPLNRSSRLRLLRALPVLAVVLILGAAIVMSIPTESGARHPTARDTNSEAHFPRPILAKSSGVWLVPLGETRSVNLPQLAAETGLRYRVPVGTLPEIALPRWSLDESQRALVAEQLILLLRRAYGARGHTVIIGITDFDMYDRGDRLAHTFSWRASSHYGVVSTSTLAANILDRIRGHSRHERTRKLVARNIGFLYYHRHEIDDPRSLLRSPMHGVGDIDKLRETP